MYSNDKDLVTATSSANNSPPFSMSAVELPVDPVIVIEPRRRRLDLNALWQSRELLYILTLREIKVRYKQSLLGILWAVVQPLSVMLVFTFFFGRLAAIPSDGVPYSLFAYAGLVLWTFFSNAVINSGNSLVGNSSLITKVYFPRIIIPLAAVCAGLIDFAISFVLLILLIFYNGIGFSLNFLMVPALAILTTLLATGLGMWMAALNVKYRDIRHAMPFFIQLWMFVTPIIYPSGFVPERWRWLLLFNPLTGLVEGFRSAVFGKSLDLPALAVSTVFIVIISVYALHRFRQLERTFADII